MFGGNMTIEEFREAHLKSDKTCILNIPPMISINTSSEILNTSYLAKLSDKKNKKRYKKMIIILKWISIISNKNGRN